MQVLSIIAKLMKYTLMDKMENRKAEVLCTGLGQSVKSGV